MSKPDLNKVLEIMSMKDEANRLYDEIDELISEIKNEYGTGRFDYELPDDSPEALNEYKYLKFEITDNIEKMLSDGVLFKSTSIKPVSFVTQGLKKCPDSLK